MKSILYFTKFEFKNLIWYILFFAVYIIIFVAPECNQKIMYLCSTFFENSISDMSFSMFFNVFPEMSAFGLILISFIAMAQFSSYSNDFLFPMPLRKRDIFLSKIFVGISIITASFVIFSAVISYNILYHQETLLNMMDKLNITSPDILNSVSIGRNLKYCIYFWLLHISFYMVNILFHTIIKEKWLALIISWVACIYPYYVLVSLNVLNMYLLGSEFIAVPGFYNLVAYTDFEIHHITEDFYVEYIEYSYLKASILAAVTLISGIASFLLYQNEAQTEKGNIILFSLCRKIFILLGSIGFTLLISIIYTDLFDSSIGLLIVMAIVFTISLIIFKKIVDMNSLKISKKIKILK